ncbi:hypothetical protein M9H77_27324 [Catharanthus roseus]|uniref:Uncharacterized protein n=1 Tax=Catharanthus roseus TaxID=4058 RepID=A0ACC0AGA5_CATRO|nr:hypothetical protein M9H77_27324 [Catharanthus roseus]
MEAKNKQEDYQYKLARDMYNFHHGGGNGFNANGGNNHGNGNFTFRRHVGVGIEDKGRNNEKELGNFLKNLPISLSLNPSLMYYEVSFLGLDVFRVLSFSCEYIRRFCAISFGGGLFLVIPYVSKCPSFHAFLEDSFLHSGSMFNPSCHDFGVMNNASIESIVVGFGLDGHVLYLDEKTNMKLIKYIQCKNHDIVNANNWLFGMKHLDFHAEGKDSRTYLFKGGVDDVNRKSQAPLEMRLGPLTRAEGKKLKIHDANVDNGRVVYMENTLKKKLEGFEDQRKASKLLLICTMSKEIWK